MNERDVPFARMIYVCTNVRDGRAACGNAELGESSGARTLEHLKEAVKSRGLKGRIRVAKSGCMDLCGLGPNVMVFERGANVCLNRVSHADLDRIVERFLVKPGE